MFFQPFFLHSAQRFLSAIRFKSVSVIALSSWGSTSIPLFSACKSTKVCMKFFRTRITTQKFKFKLYEAKEEETYGATVLGCNQRELLY